MKGKGRQKGSTQSPSSTDTTQTVARARRISHFMIDIIIDSKMILILLLCLSLTAAQVTHQPMTPQIANIRMGRTIKTVPSNTAFRLTFPMLGYDIGGTVYETHEGLVDNNLFDTSVYQPSTSCQLYRSQLKLRLVKELSLTGKQNLQSIVTSDSLKTMFAISSDQSYSQDQKKVNRMLVSYTFDMSDLSKSTQNISVSALGLNNSQTLNIKLVIVEDRIILTDGVKLVSVDYKNFTDFREIPVDFMGAKKYTYDFASQNSFLKFTLCHYSKGQGFGILLATWNTALRVYKLTQRTNKATLSNQLLPPTGNYFTDAIPDHGRYWALAEGSDVSKFVAFRPQGQGLSVSMVDLESKECFSIDKYETTVHIICTEGTLNYVGQFFLNQSFVKPQEALHLNRYYNEVDDARLLFRFGGDNNPKLIIAGDNELMLVPYAINRQVLIQSNYLPKATKLRSLGIESIHSLQTFSNFSHSYALGVGEYFIALFMIVQQPPEMQCLILRTSDVREFNILVQMNTSSCVANGDWQQLQTICTYHFPYNLYASTLEVDAANHKTIVATVLLLLLAFAILVVGCGFYCKTNIEKARHEIKKKVDALKKKKGNKPI